MQRAQSTVVGFLAVTAIAIVIAGTTFFWAKPLLDKTMAQDEVLRIENRLLETHAAITRVANMQSQATVDFNIKKGLLFFDGNNSLIFKMLVELPEPYKGVVLLGNQTYEVGVLGKDEPAYILEQGTYEAKLHYRYLRDSTNTCMGILLESGAQSAAGPGTHKLFLKWLRENTTVVSGCTTSSAQVVQVEVI